MGWGLPNPFKDTNNFLSGSDDAVRLDTAGVSNAAAKQDDAGRSAVNTAYSEAYSPMVRTDSRVVRAAADIGSRVSGGYMKERFDNLKHEADTNIQNPNQAGWKALASYLAWTGLSNAGASGGEGAASGGSAAGAGGAAESAGVMGGTAGSGAGAGFSGGSAAGGAASGGSMAGWGDYASTAASVYDSYVRDAAAEKAADAARAASADANQTQRYFFDQTRSDNLAALQNRNWALDALRARLSTPITAETVKQDPGYAFGLQTGMDQLTAAMNARGMRNSGAMLKAATQYGNDYATKNFNDAVNRRNVELAPMQSLAGLGQSGASTIAGAGQNYANAFGENVTNLANVQGALGMYQAKNQGNLVNSLAGWYGNRNSGGGGGGGNAFQGNDWSWQDYSNP